LNGSQKLRYDRNIICREIGIEGQKKLLNSRVLVCGAGGLGSGVLLNLAALGVGHIGIVDDDVVELSNLNRQYIHGALNLGQKKADSAKARIKEFDSGIEVNAFKTHLNSENYKDIVKDYDIIADCFDSFESKFLLNDIALGTGKPLVHGGVTEFFGQVMTVIPKKTACLRCIFPQNEAEYVIKGVVSPSVSTIASIEAMEVLKLILNIGSPLINRMLVFDGLKMSFKILNIERNKNCKCAKCS